MKISSAYSSLDFITKPADMYYRFHRHFETFEITVIL